MTGPRIPKKMDKSSSCTISFRNCPPKNCVGCVQQLLIHKTIHTFEIHLLICAHFWHLCRKMSLSDCCLENQKKLLEQCRVLINSSWKCSFVLCGQWTSVTCSHNISANNRHQSRENSWVNQKQTNKRIKETSQGYLQRQKMRHLTRMAWFVCLFGNDKDSFILNKTFGLSPTASTNVTPGPPRMPHDYCCRQHAYHLVALCFCLFSCLVFCSAIPKQTSSNKVRKFNCLFHVNGLYSAEFSQMMIKLKQSTRWWNLCVRGITVIIAWV